MCLFNTHLPYSGTMTATSNLGKIYSATRNDWWKSCPETSTVIFQSPRTGASANLMLAAKTPEKINDYVNSSLHKNNKTHFGETFNQNNNWNYNIPFVVNTRSHFLIKLPLPSCILTSIEPTTLGLSLWSTTTARNWTRLPGLRK